MAIDGTYLYFVTGLGAIGRANLDGTGVNQSFILGVFPEALAVDGAHIYWTTSGPNGNRIGRANLNGSGVTPMFITTTVAAAGVAVDGNFVYWTNSALNFNRAGEHRRWLRRQPVMDHGCRESPRGDSRRRLHLLGERQLRQDRARQPQRNGREPIFHDRRQAAVDRRRQRERLVDE